jgi:hypothetical protein
MATEIDRGQESGKVARQDRGGANIANGVRSPDTALPKSSDLFREYIAPRIQK